MTYVVTDNCILCKYTDCVEACPAGAIYKDDDLPQNKTEFILLNEQLSNIWPNISEQKEPLGDAKKWDGVEGKLEHLKR